MARHTKSAVVAKHRSTKCAKANHHAKPVKHHHCKTTKHHHVKAAKPRCHHKRPIKSKCSRGPIKNTTSQKTKAPDGCTCKECPNITADTSNDKQSKTQRCTTKSKKRSVGRRNCKRSVRTTAKKRCHRSVRKGSRGRRAASRLSRRRRDCSEPHRKKRRGGSKSRKTKRHVGVVAKHRSKKCAKAKHHGKQKKRQYCKTTKHHLVTKPRCHKRPNKTTDVKPQGGVCNCPVCPNLPDDEESRSNCCATKSKKRSVGRRSCKRSVRTKAKKRCHSSVRKGSRGRRAASRISRRRRDCSEPQRKRGRPSESTSATN